MRTTVALEPRPGPCPRCESVNGEWQAHASPPNGSYDHFRCPRCGHVWPVRRNKP